MTLTNKPNIYIYFAQFNGSAKEKIKYLFSWPKTIPTCL